MPIIDLNQVLDVTILVLNAAHLALDLWEAPPAA